MKTTTKKRDDYRHDVAIKATYCLFFSTMFVLVCTKRS